MSGRAVPEVNTPKKRLCSRVAQVAEAGPEGVHEVKPERRSRARAMVEAKARDRDEHAIVGVGWGGGAVGVGDRLV